MIMKKGTRYLIEYQNDGDGLESEPSIPFACCSNQKGDAER